MNIVTYDSIILAAFDIHCQGSCNEANGNTERGHYGYEHVQQCI